MQESEVNQISETPTDTQEAINSTTRTSSAAARNTRKKTETEG